MENNQEESFLQMNLDYDGGHIMRDTVRWSRFLSITGMIAISIFLLVLALASTFIIANFSRMAPSLETLGALRGVFIICGALVGLAIFGFVIFMLYRFSVLTRRGIDLQDQALFTAGMKCLKVYFVVNGILAILGLLVNLFSLTQLFYS